MNEKRTARNASFVGESLYQQMLSIYDEYLSKDGTEVDYDGISQSPLFDKYKLSTTELQRVDLTTFQSTQEKIAFFINIYNALVIHANIVLGIPLSFLSRLNFFANASYNINGYNFSLD